MKLLKRPVVSRLLTTVEIIHILTFADDTPILNYPKIKFNVLQINWLVGQKY